MPGTREQILAELEEWAVNDAAKVFWLNGMAGTGKTSIAHSLSGWLDKNQILGASFFCSRSASQEVRDASLIIPTIAAKLSQASPPLRSVVVQTINKYREVGSMHPLSKQFYLLLVGPIKSIEKMYVVVIDALDECTDLRAVEKLIQAIVEFAPDMRLKFMVTSRDTTQISEAFHHNSEYPPKILSLDDVKRSIVQGDIKTYIQNSLSAIARRSEQPLSWSPELEILLERSNRLFIYAVTVVRFLVQDDGDFGMRLAYITRLTPGRIDTEVIDSLYNDIMERAFHRKLLDAEVSARREIVSTVIFPLVPLSMNTIASLLSMAVSQPWTHLAPFRSVIHVPTADTSPINIFHTSFPDFIVDPSRCKEPFRLDQSEGNRMLTVRCLRCLNKTLERNIWNQSTNMTVSSSHIPKANPQALRYSCLHWASHLAHSLAGALAQTAVAELISEFVDKHLLHWFECLSVLGELESGIKSLDIAYKAISVSIQFDLG